MGASSKLFLEIKMDYIDELFRADDERIHLAERLLRTSLLSPEEREEIDRELLGHVEEERAEELIQYLSANQIDPITAGHNYNQTDIKNKLKREL